MGGGGGGGLHGEGCIAAPVLSMESPHIQAYMMYGTHFIHVQQSSVNGTNKQMETYPLYSVSG